MNGFQDFKKIKTDFSKYGIFTYQLDFFMCNNFNVEFGRYCALKYPKRTPLGKLGDNLVPPSPPPP